MNSDALFQLRLFLFPIVRRVHQVRSWKLKVAGRQYSIYWRAVHSSSPGCTEGVLTGLLPPFPLEIIWDLERPDRVDGSLRHAELSVVFTLEVRVGSPSFRTAVGFQAAASTTSCCVSSCAGEAPTPPAWGDQTRRNYRRFHSSRPPLLAYILGAHGARTLCSAYALLCSSDAKHTRIPRFCQKYDVTNAPYGRNRVNTPVITRNE